VNRKKNAAIPAIRVFVNSASIKKMAIFRQFLKFWPLSDVKSHYFTSVKKRHLHATSYNLKKTVPGANPCRGQERKETQGARLGSRAAGMLCFCEGALTREARTSASGWDQCVTRTVSGAGCGAA
jgi:hypothetical protein